MPDPRRGPALDRPALENPDLDAEWFGPHGTARVGRRPPTVTYLEGRERVLGRRLTLHREPAIAAALLIEELGPLGARAWCRSLLEEVGR